MAHQGIVLQLVEAHWMAWVIALHWWWLHALAMMSLCKCLLTFTRHTYTLTYTNTGTSNNQSGCNHSTKHLASYPGLVIAFFILYFGWQELLLVSSITVYLYFPSKWQMLGGEGLGMRLPNTHLHTRLIDQVFAKTINGQRLALCEINIPAAPLPVQQTFQTVQWPTVLTVYLE